MAAQEVHGSLWISDPPAGAKDAIRLTELDARSIIDKTRANHTGTQSADTLTDGSSKVAMTTTERTKLSGIAAGATANQTDAYLLARGNHTGTASADTIVDGTTNKVFTSAMSTKLSGIATGATANDTDTNLKNRANHTGSQPSSTISDFNSAVNALIQNVVGAAPAALDTLKELADSLGNDPNFAATLNSQITVLQGRVSAVETNQGNATGFATNVGDGTATAFTVTHNRNTLDIAVTVRRVSDGQIMNPGPVVKATGVNACTVDFGATVPATNAYRVLVTRVA